MYHILLIDDEEALRLMIHRALTQSGYDVLEASSGQGAIKMIHAGKIDLVITDIVMPDMDGIELMEKIHRLRKTLPIIAISGGGRIDPESYLEIANAMGAARVFAKPFKIDDLLAAVEELLKAGNSNNQIRNSNG